MARVLVLGGGFGGIATAVTLAQLAGERHEVILVDAGSDFVMGLRKNWHVVGVSTLEEGTRRLHRLAEHGVKFRQGTIEELDPVSRVARVDGEPISADYMVVALGARPVAEAVPGLAEHGINVWSRDHSERARRALAALEGGVVTVGIFGTPYSCPPGPYELALLLHDHITAAVEVFTPTPITLPVVGQVGSNKLLRRLVENEIKVSTGKKAVRVDPGVVRFEDGTEQPFNILLAVPPHRVPAVLAEGGLAEAGSWVKVFPKTLETDFPGVFAIGDCVNIPLANGAALPKAGAFAQAQGEVVASRIAALLDGRDPEATFAGEGVCYIEFGSGEAARITGHFLADPPAVSLSDPSTEQMVDKVRFESDRLTAWFGG